VFQPVAEHCLEFTFNNKHCRKIVQYVLVERWQELLLVARASNECSQTPANTGAHMLLELSLQRNQPVGRILGKSEQYNKKPSDAHLISFAGTGWW
jgi:hypothetical protein